jgi:trimeric autotransporter adhesin
MNLICRQSILCASRVLLASLALCCVPTTWAQQALTPAFTYQGELRTGNQPANGMYDFNFLLYGAQSGGSQIGSTVQVANVSVTQGLFSVALNFGAAQFAGDRQWLEIQIRPTGGGAYETLSPRSEVTAAPYAWGAAAALANSVTSTSVVDGSIGAADINAAQVQQRITGTCTSAQAISSVNANGTVVCGNLGTGTVTSVAAGAGLSGGPITSSGTLAIATGGVTSAMVLDGSIGAADINAAQVQQRVTGSCPAGEYLRQINESGSVVCAPDNAGSGGWGLAGNAGTDPATNFLGTTDAQALVLRTHNTQTLRLEPSAAQFLGVPITANVIAGSHTNSVTTGVRGATIAGGGAPPGNRDPDFGTIDANNRITDHYGTVAGGLGNHVGDNAGTFADQAFATIGGGRDNRASAYASTVGGGSYNVASNGLSTVGGGISNRASGQSSTVAGGHSNSATGTYSAVGGGIGNFADGVSGTVAGGQNNRASGARGTVAGGNGNIASGTESTVAGGNGSTASGVGSTVGGGLRNQATQEWAVVAGGRDNRASGRRSYVGGGFEHIASGDWSTVGGGWANFATGRASTIGGGEANCAGGDYSWAGGTFAAVRAGTNAENSCTVIPLSGDADGDNGTFVWSDSSSTNFFVSTGPDQFLVRATGGVAINTNTPASGNALTVNGAISASGRATIGSTQQYSNIELTVGGVAPDPFTNVFLRNLQGNGILFTTGDETGSNNASFYIDHYDGGNQGRRVELASSGSVTIRSNITSANTGVVMAASAGSWSSLSDRSVKTAIRAIDPIAILEQLIATPISSWSYIAQGESIRHIGPMAQDLARFGFGESDTHISTVDADGIALAAIQGLNAKLEAENAALRDRLQNLEERVARLAEGKE